MIYPNLILFYSAQGGAASRETVFGTASWDEAADPKRQSPLEVRYGHATGHLFAVAADGRVALLGTVVGDDDADAEELVTWFQNLDGSWPVSSLQKIRDRIKETNGRFRFQRFLQGLPLAGPDAVCVDCAKRAHRVYWGKPFCDDCLCRRLGGP
jgi:hypothetical protein